MAGETENTGATVLGGDGAETGTTGAEITPGSEGAATGEMARDTSPGVVHLLAQMAMHVLRQTKSGRKEKFHLRLPVQNRQKL